MTQAHTPSPTWSQPSSGGEERLNTFVGTIAVVTELRSQGDPRPHAYCATVFGHRLKRTFPDKAEMKAYAIRTAKSWLTNGMAQLEACSSTASGDKS